MMVDPTWLPTGGRERCEMGYCRRQKGTRPDGRGLTCTFDWLAV